MSPGNPVRVRFADACLDLEARVLTRRGNEVALTPRGFELLRLLLSERPRALRQQALRDQLWPDTAVAYTSLARLVSEVRRAVGDARREQRLIRTHHGFGYSFCGRAWEEPRLEERAPNGSVCRVAWGGREIVLPEGASLIGRASDCLVRLDTPKASRHHARLVVSGDSATIEDLGSKNGTWLGGRRLAGPTPLRDGDEIAVGVCTLLFRRVAGEGSTETL